MEKHKIHPAWIQMICCCAIIFVGLGVVINTAGIFFVSVTEELGIGRAALSLYMTVQGIANVIFLPIASKILPKYNIRVTLSLATVLIAVALAAMSSYNTVYLWYVSGAAIGIGMSFVGTYSVPLIINNWFKKKEGLAMGIAMACAGLAGVILNPVMASLIATRGWRTAYLVLAVIVAVILLPLMMFVIRFKPSDVGLKPYGEEDNAAEGNANASTPEMVGLSAAEAYKTSAFYLLCIAAACISMTTSIWSHFAGHAAASGYTTTMAATFVSCSMFGAMVGKVALGMLRDRLGIKKMIIIGCSFALVGLLLIIFGSSALIPMLIGGALYGVGCGLPATSMPFATKEVCGNKAFSAIYASVTMFTTIVSQFTIPIIGQIYDMTQSYVAGFGLIFAVVLLAIPLFFLAFKNGKKAIEKAAGKSVGY